ncbi:uncharacterized protein PV07_05217 [Cladophialophora immunda]|uniref:tyrosinase n=1 Tax=Cladophialophora immunda TaxID=569365 RepID=A0A0D2CGS3_9EURO|nr:uncharacterized protein PV07_05217 [Cladophialophora immunda]KIW29400.1 hypothetical protein PV07_05217 [Cladophialophora immunda]
MRRNHPEEWNLFLLGLERFKTKTDEDHPLSYFQIGGIHGKPFTTWPNKGWNNKMKPAPANRNQWEGFCTHSSILFLPWHRPYLALFETELRRHVQAVAEEFTAEEGYDKYHKAAQTFRLPYWDWALPADQDTSVFPWEALAGTKHNVIRPKSGGKTTPMEENPLARYTFGKVAKSYGEQIDLFDIGTTVRYPIKRSAKQDEAKMKAQLVEFVADPSKWDGKKGKNLTERVLFLLQSYDSFGPVSSNLFYKGQSFENWGSLEDVHNAIHVYTGGGGHMGDTEVAAFDPIFWLHHANIDRLYAIWQALWDKGQTNQYVTAQAATQNQASSGGTWSTPFNATETIDTALTPFTRSEAGDMWTSKDSRTTKTFGYVYPETRGWIFDTKEKIYQELDKVYKTGSLANTVKKSTKARTADTETLQLRAKALLAHDAAPKPAPVAEAASADGSASSAPQAVLADAPAQVTLPSERSLGDLVKNNKYLEWLVNIRAEKHSLGGDFAVHVFLDSPDDANSYLYLADPSHVAMFSTFGTNEQTGCGKCREGQDAQILVTGQIPLTIALVERYLAGKLDGIASEDVIPYLQQNLHWRVTDKGGARLHRGDVRGLLVTVVSNEVTLPEDESMLPQYAPTVTPWPAATTRVNGEPRGQGTGYVEGQPIVIA